MKLRNYKSPAKINLRLDIIGNRPDGYHDLNMIMVPISLFDEISFEITDTKKIEMDSNNKDLINENNLIYKTLVLLKSKFPKINKNGFRVFLTKNIPIGAGLGGGSGNAATTIVALNEIFKLHLSETTMMDLGICLGSDVPFFIIQKPAFVSGRGEKVRPFKKFPVFYCNLIYPPIAVSTKKMYDAFDLSLTRQTQDDTNARIFEGIEDLEFTDIVKLFRNDFDGLCTSAYPEISTVKALLTESNASHVMLSGSGSCVFGIYENEVLQKKAYTWLEKQCKKYSYCIWPVKTVGVIKAQNPTPKT